METRSPADRAPALPASEDEMILARCRRIATSTWSDAIDQLGIAGVVTGIVPRTGAASIAGRAVTVHEEVGPLGTWPVEAFAVGGILRAATRGAVLVIAMGGAAVSTLGGLAARAARAQGVAGVLIDGGCRDLEEIAPTGLWVASRHVTPVSGKRRVHVVSINEVVTLGEIPVAPGDYVIADATGIVVVPAAQLPAALALAEHLDSQDQRFRDALDAGGEFATIAAQLRHL